MTDNKNVFESEDSIIAMVTDAGEQLPPARIQNLYNTFRSAVDMAKKDEFYQERFVHDWNIQFMKSKARYRATENIMLDLADLWLRSDSMIRDDICRMALGGVSSDNKDFYKMMDCYHGELYQTEITDDEHGSIFSSVDAIKSTLDEAIEKPQFRPSQDMLTVVYKYVALGFNHAKSDADLRKRLSEIGIETAAGFCHMFEDLVFCYGNGDIETQMELQRVFYHGVPWDALMFRNVMDRLWKYIFKEKQANESVF